jgi:hypothetical protein
LLQVEAVEVLEVEAEVALVDTKHQHYQYHQAHHIQLQLAEAEARATALPEPAAEEVHQFLHQSHQLAVVAVVEIGHRRKAHLDLIRQQEMEDLEDLEVAEIIGDLQVIRTG